MKTPQKIELIPFPKESSTLFGYHYDGNHEKLYIGFKNKMGIKTYMYSKVPKQVVNDLLAAESHGVFFHASIKGNYETIELK